MLTNSLMRSKESNNSILGLCLAFLSYCFFLYYILWVIAPYLPPYFQSYFPAKIYRLVLPVVLVGGLIGYLTFNWICWKNETDSTHK